MDVSQIETMEEQEFRKAKLFRTYSGKLIDFNNPKHEDINFRDFARGISRIPRFGGQAKKNYSVAQHSLVVAFLCPLGSKDVGLIHDLPEGILGDVVSPLKDLLPDYRRIEKKWEEAILEKYCSTSHLPPEVKQADQLAYELERIRFQLGVEYTDRPINITIHNNIDPVFFFGKLHDLLTVEYTEDEVYDEFLRAATRYDIDINK